MAKRTVTKGTKRSLIAPEKEEEVFRYKEGEQRRYLLTSPRPEDYNVVSVSKNEKLHFLILIVATLLIRLYKIDEPSSVVFDETHFGQFANHYINGGFFVDVHPPLVKMIFAAIGNALDYHGKFPFKEIGDSYLDKSTDRMLVPYVAMRAFPGICGVATVILAYRTLRSTGCRHYIALFGSALLSIENGIVTQSRFILLDSPLLFFIASAVCMYKSSELVQPFSKVWFKFLFFSGFALGCAISSKFVGIFTIAWIFLLTLKKLWYQFGDLDISVGSIIKQSSVKAFFWIFVPAAIYLFVFAAHFTSLEKVGAGSHLMSSTFQATLEGSTIADTFADVSYGSTVSIRNLRTGAYLHSHNHAYPGLPDKNQVSLYDFPDVNNQFFVEKRVKSSMGELSRSTKQIETGRQIRLFHNATSKYLHVADIKPAVSEQDYNLLVDAIGNATMAGDNFLNFELRIQPQRSSTELGGKRLRAVESVFQLYHVKKRCFLLAHDVRLPDWGFNQREVICIEKPDYESSLWYVESNTHPMFNEETDDKVYLKPMSFLDKLVETHKVMFSLNKNILQDHPFSSRPSDWLALTRGINYSNSNNVLVYYFANYVVYIAVLVSVVLFLVTMILKTLLTDPTTFSKQVTSQAFAKLQLQGFDYVLGWIVHLVPFFLMKRQLFLHHYIPALYFGILSVAQIAEFLASKSKFLSYTLILAVLIGASGVYVVYSPLIYGSQWTKDACNAATFYYEWDVLCGQYKN